MPIGYEHHRKSNVTTFGNGVTGALLVTTDGVEIKVGQMPLPQRHTIHIINDSSNLVYIGTTPEFDPLTEGLIAFSGEVLTFDISPNPNDQSPKRFWAKVEENTATIRVLEVN